MTAKLEQLEEFLVRSLDDKHLSRGERSVLGRLLDEMRPTAHEQQLLLHRAFEMAREREADVRDDDLIEWLYDVVKQLRPADGLQLSGSRVAEAWFMPDEGGLDRLVELLDQCQQKLDICVFTITHSRLARAIKAAHRRGVSIRLMTDDDKRYDAGSDVFHLAEAGIEVRTDHSPAHMHHKFSLFDSKLLLTGSFNWTRSAVRDNQENFLVTDDPKLVQDYQAEFDRLWDAFAPRGR